MKFYAIKYALFCMLVGLLWSSTTEAAVVDVSWEITQGWVNPDGVWRTAYVFKDLASGKTHFPGPTVHANQGDTVIVHVTNALPTETVSLHWHGLVQRSSPWMDGVPFITQYPILPGETFSYVMPLGDQYGTFWYHSHSGTQYADGMYGMLVVHKLNDQINANFNVTQEAEILISEWYHRTAAVIDSELKGGVWNEFFPDFESALINGKNKFNCSQVQSASSSWKNSNPDLLGCSEGQYFSITMPQNGALRMRVLNAASGFTMRFSIDDHDLVVVAVDGIDIKPMVVQEINVYVAQRYDVIVQPMNSTTSHWIRARTFPLGADPDVVGEAKAILAYNASNPSEEPTTTVHQVPAVLANNSDLRLAIPKGPVPNATLRFDIALLCNMSEWVCYANGIAFKGPKVPAMVSSCKGEDPSQGSPKAQKLQVPYGSVVDLVFNNLGTQTHPVHLHGHHFYVLGEGAGNAGPFDGDHSKLNLDNPVLRDTLQLQERSWVVLRFVADNPGVWVVHCHIEWHIEAGMLLFIEEAPERIQSPPSNFPGILEPLICHAQFSSASQVITPYASLAKRLLALPF